MSTLQLSLFFDVAGLWKIFQKLGRNIFQETQEIPADQNSFLQQSPVTLQLINERHKDYKQVCKITKKVYKKRLEMRYSAFPANLIVAYQNGNIIGSIGITRGDEEEKLGIEDVLEITVPRPEFGEINRLNIVDRKYNFLSSYLVAEVFLYAHKIGIKKVFITIHIGAKHVLRQIGIPLHFLCDVDISAYHVKGGEKYRRLKPQAFQIVTEEAAKACTVFLEKNTLDFLSYSSLLCNI